MNALITHMQKLGTLLDLIRPSFVQTAALCWRPGVTGPEVLLVKTMRRGHWIIPKGWPMKNKSLAEAAAIEAWEEAGVTGQIGTDPIGKFTYTKIKKSGLPVQCTPQVYPLKVTQTHDDYPEAKQRTRCWFSLHDATNAVHNRELKALLASMPLSDDISSVK